jgi:hypothetical protein
VSAPREHLRIDALVVDGLPVADRAALGAAVERELARLIAEQGVPPALARGEGIASLAGRRFTASPGMDPAALGARIAGAVYGGLAP